MGLYAAWNPSDIGPNLVLSNGNLTVTRPTSGANIECVRADKGRSAGKWYWELYNDYLVLDMGIGDASVPLASGMVYSAAAGFSYIQYNGNKGNNAVASAYGSTYGITDTIGVALDMDNGEIYFSKNGVWQNSSDPVTRVNPAFTGLTGTFFPMLSMLDNSSQITANFGASAFTHTPPTGFNAGIFDSANTVPTLDLAASYLAPKSVVGQLNYVPTLAVPVSFVPPQSVRLIIGEEYLPTIYRAVLTGAADNTTDYPMQISSIQVRKRSGAPSYVSVVVPNGLAHYASIASRSNGDIVVYRGHRFSDGTEQIEEMARATLETVRDDEGGRSASITLTGHSTITYGTKTRSLTGASYKNIVNGLLRYRCQVDSFLNPGDTALINGDSFVVDTITYTIGETIATMELSE